MFYYAIDDNYSGYLFDCKLSSDLYLLRAIAASTWFYGLWCGGGEASLFYNYWLKTSTLVVEYAYVSMLLWFWCVYCASCDLDLL